MRDIHLLSPSVINKIAAGEVIERPASVVKELMENSLDAGATRVDVSVEQGGVELIRVVDDGHGIPPAQLELAVASHATSKLADADDLFQVRTLGFRGEALASIAEVSRLVLRSRGEACEEGAELEVIAGRREEVRPCGSPQGAMVEVRHLFCNTPVRRKFLRTTQTEMGHVSEAFTRLALGHPRVHFTLSHNGRPLHDLPPSADWAERIGRFFGAELAAALIPIESRDEETELTGYVAHPSQSRGNTRMQYLFLNGRSIRDRALHHALGEAYRGLLLTGRHPISFLSLRMPPEAIDVNVHPTKLEVRFQDGGRVYSQLLGALRTKFLTTDLTVRFDGAETDEPAAAHRRAKTEQLRGEFVQWAKGQAAPWGGDAEATEPDGQSAVPNRLADSPDAPLGLVRIDRQAGGLWASGEQGAPSDLEGSPRSHSPARSVGALQIHDRYLVAESEEGVVVIDQHALHERILYEQLREKILTGALESQRLLVPEPVDLSAAEAAAALDQREMLGRLGVEIEPFGGDTVAVLSYPAMLKRMNPVELLRDLVDHLLSGRKAPERRDLLDELLHMMSCKAAIKAGDRLTPEEIAALVEQRHLAQDAHHCPHGRPTALVFTREELDRQFKRT